MRREKTQIEKDVQKYRLEGALLKCSQGNHQWVSSTADGWRLCSVCRVVQRWQNEQWVTQVPATPAENQGSDVEVSPTEVRRKRPYRVVKPVGDLRHYW